MYRKPLNDGGYAYYNGKYIIVDGVMIVNPSRQILLDNGYEYYDPPQPDPDLITDTEALNIITGNE